MMGVEYKNRRGEDMFAPHTGILKHHDIVINLITFQKSMGR